MVIWTSRYSNKELLNGNYYAVGISLGRPRFRIGYELKKQCYDFAPDRTMWDKELEEFKDLYFKKLDRLGVSKVENILSTLSHEAETSNSELVLLCFEDVRDPADWCHRTMLAEWVKSRLGWEINELPNPDALKTKKKSTISAKKEESTEDTKYKQLDLFNLCNA